MPPTRYGHTDFYSVAAQVLPVLLLAIVFEQRLFRQKKIPRLLVSTVGAIIVGAFIVAEAVSLRVLYRGYAHRQDQILVIAPMLIGAVLLTLPILLPPLLELDRNPRSIQTRIAKAVNIAVAVFVLTVLLALFRQ
jgi:hypothetical protein